MDRLKFENMQCLGNGAISVEIKISPSILSQRKLLRKDVSVFDDYPLNLFDKFKSISEESDGMMGKFRKLTDKGYETNITGTFQLSRMKIIPSTSDIQMLKTHPDLVEAEKELLHIIRSSSGDNHEDAMVEKVDEVYLMQKAQEEQIHIMIKTQEEQMSKMNKLLEEEHEYEMNMLQFQMGGLTLLCMTVCVGALYKLKSY